MKPVESLQNRLLDIELPATPPEAVDYATIALAVIFALSILTIVIGFFRSQQFLNKRLLAQLKKKLSVSMISPRDASYELAKILKSAQKTSRLIPNRNPSNQWNAFIAQLSDLRYKESDCDKTAVLKLINDAQSWLKSPQS